MYFYDLNNNEVHIKNNETKEEDIISLDVLIYYLDEKLNTGDDCGCGCDDCYDEYDDCGCGHCHDEEDEYETVELEGRPRGFGVVPTFSAAEELFLDKQYLIKDVDTFLEFAADFNELSTSDNVDTQELSHVVEAPLQEFIDENVPKRIQAAVDANIKFDEERERFW